MKFHKLIVRYQKSCKAVRRFYAGKRGCIKSRWRNCEKARHPGWNSSIRDGWGNECTIKPRFQK